MIDNPYLEASEQYCGDFLEVRGWPVSLTIGRVDDIVDSARKRKEMCAEYSYAIPNDAAIACLVKHSPIIEIGAGTGYWAKLVREAGGDIRAFDNFRWAPLRGRFGAHFPVERGTPETAALYPDRSLFLCWPPYHTRMAWRALKAHGDAGGKRAIVVGEGEGGCTGDDRFFRLLDDRYDLVENVTIPQWYGIHDFMAVYEKKRAD